MSRLAVLEASLAKKETKLNQRFDTYFGDVKAANGQPLNDKRNGRATLNKWSKNEDSIRTAQAEIEKTKEAIEREKNLIANVEMTEIPAPLAEAVTSGEIVQWRKHPNTFFVKGVDKGRRVWLPDAGELAHKYTAEVPKDQFPLFRDTFNKLRHAVKAFVASQKAQS